MEHNRNTFALEAATDEPASFSRPFATPAEEAAWWAGVQAGLRRAGIAGDADPADPLAFDPVPVRLRDDGLTPGKQREYVEALADTGIGRTAAARVGVSERSIARLRRRSDARSFDLACAAARRFGARQLHATAWERAIEGTLKGHYYHGELKSEERVYDNRLLIYLLGKTGHLLAEPPEAAAVAANWEPFVEAMEQGLPPPDLAEATAPDDLDLFDDDGICGELWQEEDGAWWTSWPPPAGFDGVEHGSHGDPEYKRVLSDAELRVAETRLEDEDGAATGYAAQIAERDAMFGFQGGCLDEPEG